MAYGQETQYDATGNRTDVTVLRGTDTTYTVDAFNRVTRVNPWDRATADCRGYWTACVAV
jgi:uncharacterized protein RhaS with RHS repeats